MKKSLINKSITIIISIIPITILYAMLFYGLIISVLRSIGYYEAIGQHNFTLEYITTIIDNKTIFNSLINTFMMAFVEATLSVVIAILVSIYLIKIKIKQNSLLLIPVSIPHIVVGMMIILLFAQNGFFSRVFYHLHLIESPLKFLILINDKYNIGVIIAYLYKGIAYTLSVIYIILQKHDNKYYEVAKTMNISFIKYVKDILIPHSFDAIMSCFLILFSYSFGAYELPYLLGNTNNKLLPVLAYEKYLSPNLYDKPIFLSINLIMIFAGVVVLVFYKRLADKLTNEKHYI